MTMNVKTHPFGVTKHTIPGVGHATNCAIAPWIEHSTIN